MLDTIAALLRKYLVANAHQINILTAWIVHTWCYEAFPTTPYLDISSPAPQCGKTRCLQLLSALCRRPWLKTGPPSPTLIEQLVAAEREREQDPKIERACGVLLLDDRDQTFAERHRQPLVALFNSGADAHSTYLCRVRGGPPRAFGFFYPKVFAGGDRLQHSLADRCIPIILHRKKPSQTVERFARAQLETTARRLTDWMAEWGRQNFKALVLAAQSPPPGLPPNLTARQQDCTEPLLHVANRIGGHWPERVRAALVPLWDAFSDDSGSSEPLQLLADMRLVFYSKKNPEYLFTKDIISVLQLFESRPWAGWTGKSGKQIAMRLGPFGINSRNLRYADQKPLKGYRLCDFQDAWERYLPPLPENMDQIVTEKTQAVDKVA